MSSRMHRLLNGRRFHKTGYRLRLLTCAGDVVLLLMPMDVIRFFGKFFLQRIKNYEKIQSARITCFTSNFGGATAFAVATRGCVDLWH